MEEFQRVTGGPVFVNPLGVAGVEPVLNEGENQAPTQSIIHLFGGGTFTVRGSAGDVSRRIGDRITILTTHRSVERS